MPLDIPRNKCKYRYNLFVSLLTFIETLHRLVYHMFDHDIYKVQPLIQSLYCPTFTHVDSNVICLNVQSIMLGHFCLCQSLSLSLSLLFYCVTALATVLVNVFLLSSCPLCLLSVCLSVLVNDKISGLRGEESL